MRTSEITVDIGNYSEEAAAETTCSELAKPPILIPLCCSGEKVEKWGGKANPGRREGWGESVLRFSFYFLLSYSHLTGNK